MKLRTISEVQYQAHSETSKVSGSTSKYHRGSINDLDENEPSEPDENEPNESENKAK